MPPRDAQQGSSIALQPPVLCSLCCGVSTLWGAPVFGPLPPLQVRRQAITFSIPQTRSSACPVPLRSPALAFLGSPSFPQLPLLPRSPPSLLCRLPVHHPSTPPCATSSLSLSSIDFFGVSCAAILTFYRLFWFPHWIRRILPPCLLPRQMKPSLGFWRGCHASLPSISLTMD